MRWHLVRPLEGHRENQAVEALRQAYRDLFKGENLQAIPGPAGTDANSFFLKARQGILWAKVYRVPLPEIPLAALVRQRQSLARTVKEPVFLCVLFPSLSPQAASAYRPLEGEGPPMVLRSDRIHFAEYFFVRDASGGEVLILREWRPVPSGIPCPMARDTASSVVPDPLPEEKPQGGQDRSLVPRFGFYRNGQLSRAEIADLMNLSLDFRRLKEIS